jgi:RNA polymerase sigma-70 factor (ECF subfamily)
MTDQARDAGLIERMRSGDRAALEALYDRHTPMLLGVAVRILRDRAEAEDAVQETWVQVWRRCAGYDRRRGSVAAWLVTIARTRALDRYRSRASRARAEGAPAAPVTTPDDAERGGALGQLRVQLGAALAGLDPRQREVLEIAYFEGLSQSEIAARLVVPLGTVKHWTRQGLLALRAAMPKDAWT